LSAVRAELGRLDDEIGGIEDMARRDRCAARAQAIRFGVDRLEDLVAQLAAGL
jgi:hypothetical protein